MDIDLEAIADLIHETAQALVLPRFEDLAASDVDPKPTPGDPDDIVTRVDREVEAHLARELTARAPGAVLGEEIGHHRPELLDLVHSDRPLWIIDPIDGTKNFAAGRTGFGIMVARVVHGQTRAAWIVLPARRQTFMAALGDGAYLDGERIHVTSPPLGGLPRGAVMTRYMPGDLAETVVRAMNGRHSSTPPSGAAAIEYTDILMGERDFVIYYRLLPWDHAAPALILTEAGGHVGHVAGGAYSVRSRSQLTVVARDRGSVDEIRGWLSPSGPSIA